MTINSKYREQIALLIEIIEPVLDDERLALKGGTAINLFTMNMPRLSVDLDITYLPVTGREEFISDIKDTFQKMERRLRQYSLESASTSEGVPKQIRVSQGNVEVKVEVNLTLRGSVFQTEIKTLCEQAQREFEKSVKILCVSFEDLYAGKFCAALDRQHPRDLYDVKLFFELHKFTDNLKKAFLVYLISGNRPIHEMLQPNLIDQKTMFANQFLGMTEKEVTYEDLEASRAQLIKTINANLTDEDKTSLLSIKKGAPRWDLLGIPGIEALPGVQWKLRNIAKISPAKHIEMLKKLERILWQC